MLFQKELSSLVGMGGLASPYVRLGLCEIRPFICQIQAFFNIHFLNFGILMYSLNNLRHFNVSRLASIAVLALPSSLPTENCLTFHSS